MGASYIQISFILLIFLMLSASGFVEEEDDLEETDGYIYDVKGRGFSNVVKKVTFDEMEFQKRFYRKRQRQHELVDYLVDIDDLRKLSTVLSLSVKKLFEEIIASKEYLAQRQFYLQRQDLPRDPHIRHAINRILLNAALVTELTLRLSFIMTPLLKSDGLHYEYYHWSLLFAETYGYLIDGQTFDSMRIVGNQLKIFNDPNFVDVNIFFKSHGKTKKAKKPFRDGIEIQEVPMTVILPPWRLHAQEL